MISFDLNESWVICDILRSCLKTTLHKTDYSKLRSWVKNYVLFTKAAFTKYSVTFNTIV